MDNQTHKNLVWSFWQDLETCADADLGEVLARVVTGEIDWYGPEPIGRMQGNEAYVNSYLLPLRKSFADLKRQTHIFMGGASDGKADGSHDGTMWVGGTGYLVGTFVEPFLGIPASDDKVSIRWGEFHRMADGKIEATYFLLDLIDLMQQAGVSVLPPARGQDHLYPPPEGGGGVLLGSQSEAETRKTERLIREFLFDSLNSYDQSQLESMGVADYFVDEVQWYGPGGIGACLSLKEFEDLHQEPWLVAFPDRQVQDLDSLFSEGEYTASSGWSAVAATHAGPYLGTPASHNAIVTNGIDFWRRRDGKFIENWVFVDMIHLFRQFGVNLMERIQSS